MKSKTDWPRLKKEAESGIEPDLSGPDDREPSDAEFAAAISRRRAGRPVSETHKVPLSIRLSDDIVTFFKSTGRGWQSRMNEALREWIKGRKSV